MTGAPDLPIASLGKRGAAAMLDSCLVTVVWGVVLGIVWITTGASDAFWSSAFASPADDLTRTQLLGTAGQYVLAAGAWVLYAGRLTGRADGWNGQTLGKRAAQLRIVTASGAPLPARMAWRRALLSAVPAVPGVIGPLVDVAIGGGSTTGLEVGTIVVLASGAIVILCTLRGGLRQSAFDLGAGTVVVALQSAAAPAGAAADTDARGPATWSPTPAGAAPAVTLAQPTADLPGRIVPRPRTARTWVGVIVVALLSLSLIPLSSIELPSEDRRDEILALPETKKALADAREVETLIAACLAGGKADRCDSPDELGASGAEVIEFFDYDLAATGEYAGQVGVVADGDDAVIVYAFTGGDRIWASIVEGGDVQHSCIKASTDDLCDGVWDW